MSYEDFLKKKLMVDVPAGIDKDVSMNSALFDYQKPCVQWALKRGRSILAEDCGLGKTIQELEWARIVHEHTNGDVLILAPLAVAMQTVDEGKKFGYSVNLCRNQDQVKRGVNVTNYEMLHHFDPRKFIGVVGDEISCMKNETSATRKMLTDYFQQTPYRLGCTATPSPNDYMELGVYAEWLGVMTRSEMLATFFTHDGGETSKWRLKGHAVDVFWRWVSTWMLCFEKPSDIGFSDDGYTKPSLNEHWHVLSTDPATDGYLIPMPASTLNDQRSVKRNSVAERVKFAADMANDDSSDNPWLIWGELNDECDLAEEAINGSVQVAGRDSTEEKERKLMGFIHGEYNRLISKFSIAGFGLNMQRCADMAVLNVTHSAEQYYQGVRRCWRYAQARPVNVHNIMTEAEQPIRDNRKRKEVESDEMRRSMIVHMADAMKGMIGTTKQQKVEYEANERVILPSWINQQRKTNATASRKRSKKTRE